MSNDGPDIAGPVLTPREHVVSDKGDLAILFKIGAGDPALWKREITARVPGQEFRAWPDAGDPDAIEFVLLFRPAPGMFLPFRTVQALLCTGAWVDRIPADPELPRPRPVARLGEP